MRSEGLSCAESEEYLLEHSTIKAKDLNRSIRNTQFMRVRLRWN